MTGFAIECILRVTLLLLVAFAIAFLMRRESAAFRHLLWMIALALVSLTPLLMITGPRWLPRPSTLTLRSPFSISAVHPTEPVVGPTPARTLNGASWPDLSLPNVFALLWAAGLLAAVLRLLHGHRMSWRLRRHCRPIEAVQLAERTQLPVQHFSGVRFAESSAVVVPMTLGIWAPLILLPVSGAQWQASRLRSVLLHELAHVRRRDCLVQALAGFVCALYWFHPLLWSALAHLRAESERASDDAVLNFGVAPDHYASDLLEIARTTPMKGNYPMSLAFTSQLERRIVRLLDPQAKRKPMGFLQTAIASLVAIALLSPVAFMQAQEANTGTLAGVVADPSGAMVPGVDVILARGSTMLRKTKADAAGAWQFADVDPGEYALLVSAPGFWPFLQADVGVAAGRRTTVEASLAVESRSETLTVVAQGVTPTKSGAAARRPVRIRVGGNVQTAKVLSQIQPVYPDSARQQGIEGTVNLQAVIGTNGGIVDARVVSASGSEALAQAALAAVRAWHYEPTLLNGQPVEVLTEVAIDFRLN